MSNVAALFPSMNIPATVFGHNPSGVYIYTRSAWEPVLATELDEPSEIAFRPWFVPGTPGVSLLAELDPPFPRPTASSLRYTFGAQSWVPVDEPREWETLNRRRLSLINRKHDQGLTPDEEDELNALQNEADEILEATSPLILGYTQQIEEWERRAGFQTG